MPEYTYYAYHKDGVKQPPSLVSADSPQEITRSLALEGLTAYILYKTGNEPDFEHVYIEYLKHRRREANDKQKAWRELSDRLFEKGDDLTQALKSTASTCETPRFRTMFQHASEHIGNGSLNVLFEKFLPERDLIMLDIAEQTGKLPWILERMSSFEGEAIPSDDLKYYFLLMFAPLIDAGLPVVRALAEMKRLESQNERSKLIPIIEHMLSLAEQDVKIPELLGHFPLVFDPLFIRLVKSVTEEDPNGVGKVLKIEVQNISAAYFRSGLIDQ